ncbi:MAG: GNAT family N-acetyltransferase [Alphaproteobacteria bacterium]|nr:GNAT family N-acetyltransferase [Alphaproteobacteria bacterium]
MVAERVVAAAERPELVPETPAHAAALDQVLNRAFGPGRFAKTSERVRERGAVHRLDVSRTALLAGTPIGCCRLHDIAIGAEAALLLGPLAVDPEHQHDGLGAALVAGAVEAARREGGVIILVGAPAFFAPLGFTQAPPGRVALPGPVDPARLLWLELSDGALDRCAGAVTAPRAATRT